MCMSGYDGAVAGLRVVSVNVSNALGLALGPWGLWEAHYPSMSGKPPFSAAYGSITNVDAAWSGDPAGFT